ncbi:type 11 methyltransferase [Rhodococcus opacus M213]|uniref:Type 11 methyltransferase n=1 Tax=Rhodococcus opacus M213 TaxID=1129896 RepID=K8XIS0_RHOOP|nr:type 11 methyltransferase [Rhodococcus opacus M213]
MFAGYVDTVQVAAGGPVTDLGHRIGRITAHLHRLGLSEPGIDRSPQMVGCPGGPKETVRQGPGAAEVTDSVAPWCRPGTVPGTAS